MTDALPVEPRERGLRLRYSGDCRVCGTALVAGTRARWDPGTRTVRCLVCPTARPVPNEPPAASVKPRTATTETALDWGIAGASAQSQFDRQEGRRRDRLRSRWAALVALGVFGAMGGGVLAATLHAQTTLFMAIGAILPVLKVLTTPQHIDAWRSGAVGEREVGARLDKLRTIGILTLHDRRVLGRRTNIDHIAIPPAGVFVIDTKNVAGKVSASRNGLHVAGRRRDSMVTGVQGQIAVVRQALHDQPLAPEAIRGALCFTRTELPWSRATLGGVALLDPRGLARILRRPGTLSPDDIHQLASVLAERLPVA
jgi:hypothetical protein